MDINIAVIVGLLFTHLVADFFLQSDWMALNKSKNWDALLAHTSLYSMCFFWLGVDFMAWTYIAHTITDAATSRITSKLWFIDFASGVVSIMPEYPLYARITSGKRHWFFVAIGVDQFIHYVTLLYTYQLVR